MKNNITFDKKECVPVVAHEVSVFNPPTRVKVVCKNAFKTIYLPFTIEKYKEYSGVYIGDKVELNGEDLWVVSIIGEGE